jgi:thymidylate kinase
MNKLFIIEGPDECGKTTLALSMAERLRGIYFHCTATPDLFTGLRDYHHNILDNVEQNLKLSHPVILDRHWCSEVVYGKLFRPEREYLYSDILKRIKDMDGRYIFAFSPTAAKRYAEGHIDPAHSLTEAQFRTVWDGYVSLRQRMMDEWEIPIKVYMLDEDGKDDLTLHKFIIDTAYGF